MNTRAALKLHVERQQEQRERKRVRRRRAEIHAAMERAAEMARERLAYTPPFRCEQRKS